ncbi:MAG: hypothetical protein F4018_13365 [Acidobacteria bacterium]|nr:hypothetical protein [Acidobacteriota bacterium]MYH28842.1 hypothetical protein [Acidobacteriota bacterium]MYK89235.1 hypothetical protein [Acidobacteriota bacterium]MYN67415.1 hypothetical protein [Acidobacteriota bacterium]
MQERAVPHGAETGLRLLAVAAVATMVGCSPPPPNPTASVSDVQVEIATNPETGNPMGRRITGSLQLADPGTPAASDPFPRIQALVWRGETASRRTCEHTFPDGIATGETHEFEIICSAPGNDLSFVVRSGGDRDRTYPCDGCERRPIL